MKRPTLKGRLGDTESSTDTQTTKTIVDALTSNDKVIEIRPAERSRLIGPKRLLLLGAGAIGLAYWVQNSQRPNDLLRSVKGKTLDRSDEAAETIEAGSKTASERIEAGSQRAGEKADDDTSSFSRD